MKLEQIGFYTLSDSRAASASQSSPLQRCELVLTGRCNFKCPYCRRVGGPDKEFNKAAELVCSWADQGLRAIRFSGGEPTLYPRLKELVQISKLRGIEKIAISTNGSAPLSLYKELIAAGVNDLSISLDACCAEDGLKMTGGIKGAWETVVANIHALSSLVYITVGVVLTDDNVDKTNDIIAYAASLGVKDIRIIPAAQNGNRLHTVHVDEELLEKFPILRYRIKNIQNNVPVRGIGNDDSNACGLVLDDMAANGEYHYPCIIYMREGGAPIGKIGPDMRRERFDWFLKTDTSKDPICSKNCLDVCVHYNNTFQRLQCLSKAA